MAWLFGLAGSGRLLKRAKRMSHVGISVGRNGRSIPERASAPGRELAWLLEQTSGLEATKVMGQMSDTVVRRNLSEVFLRFPLASRGL
jgi:hypothetical protein